jgi:hypothetical protein
VECETFEYYGYAAISRAKAERCNCELYVVALTCIQITRIYSPVFAEKGAITPTMVFLS